MLNDFNQSLMKIAFENSKAAKEEARKRLEEEFVMRETKFDKAVSRLTWHVVGWRSRLITTPLGDIKINRRIYRLKGNRKVTKILFDEHINLEPRKTFLSEMDYFIVSKIPSVKSYEKLVELLGLDISPSTISRKVASYEFSFIPKKLATVTQTVFINMDGIWTNRHKGMRKETKCVVAFTGTIVKNNRKTLVNRVILPYQDNISSEEMASRIEDWLAKIYGEIKTKIVIGDGASWITNVAKHLGAKRFIDRFHFKKWIKDFVGRKNNIDWNKVLKMDINGLVTYLHMLIADENGVVCISEKQKNLLPKIKRFFTSFKEISKCGHISCIEGIQSHYVASHFKTRRAFSHCNTYKIMMLNLIKANNWNISPTGITSSDFYEGATIEISSLRTSSFSNVPYLSSTSAEVVKHFNTLIHV